MAHHFFLPHKINPNLPVVLEGENAHHARNVLRLRVGDTISLADGTGKGYEAGIIKVEKKRLVAEIKSLLANFEPRLQIGLYQGWPKGHKLDFIIEKNTELGVARIEVLITERSIPHPDQQTIKRRRQRWQQKALAAARQSHRLRVPPVNGPLELTTALPLLKPDTLLLVPWEQERKRTLKAVLEASKAKGQEMAVLIGPEGGLSPVEIDFVSGYGGVPVSLGPRILRTETAGIVCLTAIMYAFGEL